VRLNDVRTLFDYLFWAHERMIAPLLEAPPEDFTRELPAGQGSVRDTLVHMMSSEWIWLSRWHGVSPGAMLDPEAFPTLEALEERWGRIRVELQRFLGQVREDDLPRPLTYRNTDGEELQVPLECAMEHVVHESGYRRGLLAAQLRQLGLVPLPADLLLYYLEEEGGEFARPTRRWEQTHRAARRDNGGRRDEEEDED
jgi:uncharacterized damage-inducible protein DinB